MLQKVIFAGEVCTHGGQSNRRAFLVQMGRRRSRGAVPTGLQIYRLQHLAVAPSAGGVNWFEHNAAHIRLFPVFHVLAILRCLRLDRGRVIVSRKINSRYVSITLLSDGRNVPVRFRLSDYCGAIRCRLPFLGLGLLEGSGSRYFRDRPEPARHRGQFWDRPRIALHDAWNVSSWFLRGVAYRLALWQGPQVSRYPRRDTDFEATGSAATKNTAKAPRSVCLHVREAVVSSP